MKKALVVCSSAFNEEQRTTLEIVKRVLKTKKLKSAICDRRILNKANFLDCDLVIAVGGDGTFLRASHFIKDNTLIFGVNSDMQNKEGFYMKCNRYDFEKKLVMLQKGRFLVRKLMRLEAFINKRGMDELALNEFYFGSYKPYLISRYKLQIRNAKERQRSSGIIISTPTGSNAWLKACGVKIKLEASKSNEANKFTYFVREPYEGRILGNYNLLFGSLRVGEEIRIKSEIDDAIVVADSLSKEYKVHYGNSVVIGASDKFLRAVDFP